MGRSFFLQYPIILTAFTAISFDVAAQPTSSSIPGSTVSLQLPALSAQSPIRQKLEALAEPQQRRAIAWLQSFSFPRSDAASLRIDNAGGVYYSDAIKPKPRARSAASVIGFAVAQSAEENDVFRLHSRPTARNHVFLDFDGQTITGTAWNDTISSYHAAGFDLDGNPANFSNDERSKIAEIWHRISEDFAPFNIDVTTEEPDSFSPYVGHILFTRDVDQNGIDMPSKGSAGVSYVNVWGISDYAGSYSPALVYYNVLDGGYAPYVAEVGSHEFGHNLGLSHDGTNDGSQNPFCINNNEYFCGLGSGATSWAPIMGVGYYANVTEWSKGEYPDANNTQDDIGIIVDKLGFRVDDIKVAFAEATPLSVERDGGIGVSNPQNDPLNIDPVNKGVIETRNDIDTFSFDTVAGPVNITINPAWDAYFRSNQRGANLDIKASLYDANGTLIVFDEPSDETYANISATLAAGRYYLTVSGVGNNTTPYSDYGSMGEYFIYGRIASAQSSDNLPPTPNPMAWATKPYAIDRDSVEMTATLATDASSEVQYQFRCVSGGQGCVDSNWQSSRNYVAANLAQGSPYSFTVVARDQAGNQTAPSSTASITTKSNQTPLAFNDSGTVALADTVMLGESTVEINVADTLTLPVLDNDTDIDNDGIFIISTGTAKFGSVSKSGKSIIYKPNNNGKLVFKVDSADLNDFFAGDSFSYTISDGHGGKDSATVTIKPDQLMGL